MDSYDMFLLLVLNCCICWVDFVFCFDNDSDVFGCFVVVGVFCIMDFYSDYLLLIFGVY